MRILVVTISDRASQGGYEDLSGPEIEKILLARVPDVEVSRSVVSDEPSQIEGALLKGMGADVILTTGGTGIGPRDNTPDVTRRLCEREVPGIAECLRLKSLEQTPQAMLSRAFAGTKGDTLIVNLPGSVKGVRFCTELLLPVLSHAKEMMAGKGH